MQEQGEKRATDEALTKAGNDFGRVSEAVTKCWRQNDAFIRHQVSKVNTLQMMRAKNSEIATFSSLTSNQKICFQVNH